MYNHYIYSRLSNVTMSILISSNYIILLISNISDVWKHDLRYYCTNSFLFKQGNEYIDKISIISYPSNIQKQLDYVDYCLYPSYIM